MWDSLFGAEHKDDVKLVYWEWHFTESNKKQIGLSDVQHHALQPTHHVYRKNQKNWDIWKKLL